MNEFILVLLYSLDNADKHLTPTYKVFAYKALKASTLKITNLKEASLLMPVGQTGLEHVYYREPSSSD